MTNTPRTADAIATFNGQCDTPVAASLMAELELDRNNLHAALKAFVDAHYAYVDEAQQVEAERLHDAAARAKALI